MSEILHHALTVATKITAELINAIALAMVIAGTVQAVVGIVGILSMKQGRARARRTVWIRLSHWLVGALTMQLAADIINSAIAPSWDEVGRLAAIAAIRTFLNYFLERDVTERLRSDGDRSSKRRRTRDGQEQEKQQEHGKEQEWIREDQEAPEHPHPVG